MVGIRPAYGAGGGHPPWPGSTPAHRWTPPLRVCKKIYKQSSMFTYRNITRPEDIVVSIIIFCRQNLPPAPVLALSSCLYLKLGLDTVNTCRPVYGMDPRQEPPHCLKCTWTSYANIIFKYLLRIFLFRGLKVKNGEGVSAFPGNLVRTRSPGKPAVEPISRFRVLGSNHCDPYGGVGGLSPHSSV